MPILLTSTNDVTSTPISELTTNDNEMTIDIYQQYKYERIELLKTCYNHFKTSTMITILAFNMFCIYSIHCLWYVLYTKISTKIDKQNSDVSKQTTISYSKNIIIYALLITICLYNMYNKLFGTNKIYNDYIKMKQYANMIQSPDELLQQLNMKVHRNVVYILLLLQIILYILCIKFANTEDIVSFLFINQHTQQTIVSTT